MPTDIPSPLRLLLWVAVGLAVLGFTYAFKVAIASRKVKQALEQQQAQTLQNLAQIDSLKTARLELAQALSALQYELDVEKQNAVPVETGPGLDVRQLEANLEQAHRDRESSEQALKQSKLVVQRRQLEIAKLASQVDDLALNLEETRILVAEKERAALEAAHREQAADNELAQLRPNEALYRQRLEESVGQLKVQQEMQARAEQALQQARATIHQWESNVTDGAQQLAALARQLEEKQTAYGTLERMLQEATAAEVQLRRDLKGMTSDREQLEIQNIELKNVLSQMSGGGAVPAISESVTHPDSRGSWPTVTESDIQSAVLELRAMPSIQAEPYRSVAEAAQTRFTYPESSDLETELRDARLRLQHLESGMGDLEYLREQNARLREDLLQDRGASRELTALQLEHKRLKLDLQLAEQKLSTQADSIEDLSGVASELQDHKEELEALRNMRAQLRDLRAENFALRSANSGTFRVSEAIGQLQSDSRELAASALDTAVLSDHLGLPVAATGSLPAESLAAVSGIAAQGASQVRELLPIGPISTVQWIDQYGITVTCRLFRLAGDDMAMTTLASGSPSEQTLKQTMKTVLESIGWNEDGPQTDVTNSAAG